ncbi:lipase family protein [Streptomyces sp. TLI_146]|uniref:lipase family protein n=1 Tax=Streptomyces sp. TLI_146 TaxID=1938858 RepID=UPI000C714E03|nr:lipase family protein [Streptomyces sp. TLI_146]PKV83208.1 secretory lipase [Streptomyces sp. TLI_146]
MTSRRTRIRILAGAAVLGSVSALVAPVSAVADSHGEPARGGAVVSVEQAADLTAQEVAGELRGTFDSSQVRYGVTAYRVTYRTTDSAGAPTTASQLVVLPTNGTRYLSTVSWLHGTTVYRKDVASEDPKSNDRLTALLFASTGRAVSAPDYVGLGSGEGFHPYGDPRATVAASVDGLRAARTLAHRKGRELKRKVQVSGFSQGGPATMLVGRALQQEGADRYFRLGALAPVSGPYDLSAFEAAAADDKIEKSGIYLAYFVTAWNKMYGLYTSPGDVFNSHYADKVEGLFDGYHTTEQIVDTLPAASKDLFTEDFLNKIREPGGVLKDKLRPMDHTCDWRPNVPVEIFHGRGDKDVDFSHATYCADQLVRNGAAPRLTDVGDHDHSGSLRQALPRIVRFFDESAKTD